MIHNTWNGMDNLKDYDYEDQAWHDNNNEYGKGDDRWDNEWGSNNSYGQDNRGGDWRK